MSKTPDRPSFGGQGQARQPKFQVNDLVYVVNPPNMTAGTPTKTSPFSKPPAALSIPNQPLPKSQTNKVKLDEKFKAAPTAEFIKHTVWKVMDVEESDSTKEEHVYHLQPNNICHIARPESQLLPIGFLPRDIIRKDGEHYEVLEVNIIRDKSGELVVKYFAKDDLGTESLFDHTEVLKGEKSSFKHMFAK